MTRSFFMHARWLALPLLAGLAACASDPVRIPMGAMRADAIAQAGPPTTIYLLPDGGERLQYSRAPMGTEVTNVDTNAAGRVVSVRQVLDERYFSDTIQVDVWREADVLRTYGRPYEISRVSSFNGVIWSWRYRQINAPRFLHIYIDPQGVVRRYHVADDYTYERRLFR